MGGEGSGTPHPVCGPPGPRATPSEGAAANRSPPGCRPDREISGALSFLPSALFRPLDFLQLSPRVADLTAVRDHGYSRSEIHRAGVSPGSCDSSRFGEISMPLDLYFHGTVNYASEHTIYRIYFENGRFTFIRKGRNEPYAGTGLSGRLLVTAIRTAVNAAANNGPALAALNEEEGLDRMLQEHRRNFSVPADALCDSRLKWDWVTRVLISNPPRVIWHISPLSQKPLKVQIWGDNMKIAVPLLIARYGAGIIEGPYHWDEQTERFCRSHSSGVNHSSGVHSSGVNS